MVEKAAEKQHSIGELSKLAATSPRTIRYYEEIGLIDPPQRRGNKRLYDDDYLRKLKFIKRLKLLGLSLAEITELGNIYRIHQSNERVLRRLLELLVSHHRRIDCNIGDLMQLKGEIESYRNRILSKLNRSSNH